MSLNNLKRTINNWIQLDTFGAILTYGTLALVAGIYLFIY